MENENFTGSVLSGSMNLKGSLSCKGELQIEGKINGDIKGERVFLGDQSVVEGNLTADELVVSGKFKGKIKGKMVRLNAGASVDGEVYYETLAIEDGSIINGEIKKIINPKDTVQVNNIMEKDKSLLQKDSKNIVEGLGLPSLKNS